MQVISETDPDKAVAIIQALDLPPPVRAPVLKGAAQMAAGGYIPGSLVVGSQVTEFASGIDQTLRSEILKSFLVAQLAANSFLRDMGGGSAAWYERYFYILAASGWNVQRPDPITVKRDGDARELYRELVPIVTAALGQDAGRSTVLKVLKGLGTMAPDRPWLTLFERESQRASANQFQVSYVGDASGAGPHVTFTSFELEAHQSVTRVLFFRFEDGTATLRHSTAKLTMNRPVFDRVKPFVDERIQEQLGSYLESVEL